MNAVKTAIDRHRQELFFRHVSDETECDPPPTNGTVADSSDADGRIRHLELEIQQLQLTVRRLRQLAYVDGLTGLANRRYFDFAVDSEIRRACRDAAPLSLLVCDVDHFKQINDTFGHPCGDDVLSVLGQLFRRQCRRAGDFAARYGGEEFAVLLPAADAKETIVIAERLRRSAADLWIQCSGARTPIRVTISVGVTTFRSATPYAPSLIVDAADTGLYRAKQAGRNCVRFQAPDGE